MPSTTKESRQYLMDNQTYSLLKLFNQRDSLSLDGLAAIYDKDFMDFVSSVSWMVSHNYLAIISDVSLLEGYDLTPDKPLEITQDGIMALDDETKARRRFKHSEFRAWFTLFIALFALFLSIISLYLQYI